MRQLIVCCCVLLVCGVAEAGKVSLIQFDSAVNAQYVGYTYTETTAFSWSTFSYVTTETIILAVNMADTKTPGYNYIYGVNLITNAHVVGTSYKWRIRPGTLTPPAGVGAPIDEGDQVAVP